MNDYPLEDVLKDADNAIEAGATIFQKFTCCKCGQRLTMDVPNTFYTQGSCDKCGELTDLQKTGCNFMAVIGTKK
jgi:hypothetical protein